MFPKFSVRVRRIWCSCFFFMQLRNAPLLFTENQTHACNDSLNRLRHKLQVFADWFKECSPLTRKFLSKASRYHLIIFVASTEQRRTLIIKKWYSNCLYLDVSGVCPLITSFRGTLPLKQENLEMCKLYTEGWNRSHCKVTVLTTPQPCRLDFYCVYSLLRGRCMHMPYHYY